jgi:hypothetical protein
VKAEFVSLCDFFGQKVYNMDSRVSFIVYRICCVDRVIPQYFRIKYTHCLYTILA